MIYTIKPRSDVYCYKLNFNILNVSYWTKRFYRAKQTSNLEKKCRADYKDGSGLQFINFVFATGGQEIEVSTLVEI